MEVRVKRSNLLSELIPMQGIVGAPNHDPGALSHPPDLVAEDDRLYLASTDLDVSLTSSCEAEVSGSGSNRGSGEEVRRDHPRRQIAEEVGLSAGRRKETRHRCGQRRASRSTASRPRIFRRYPKCRATDELARSRSRCVQTGRSGASSSRSRPRSRRFQLNGALLKLKDGGTGVGGNRRPPAGVGRERSRPVPRPTAYLVPRKALQELHALRAKKVICRFEEASITFRSGSGVAS